MTLFEMKEKLAALDEAIKSDSMWIAEKTADATVKMEDLTEKEAHRDELVKRKELLQKEHDKAENAQRKTLEKKVGKNGVMTEAENMIQKKAEFYRNALTGADVSKSYEGLGGIPAASADLGYGSNLLPVNLSNELIVAPVEENSLRSIEMVSQIKGLEEPTIAFTIENTDLADVLDTATANEVAMTGGMITYGRHKVKISATVKDTVLFGTDTNLVSTIEANLRSGLAMAEKRWSFLGSSDSTHDNMSFYLNDITTVYGSNLIQAIINAWAALPESFSENARVVMKKSDYYAAIQTLAGSGNDLWGKKPEDVIGIPVVFNDKAVTPIVGDFRFARLNYDIDTIFETDKDAKKGEYYFVLTAWFDHRIRLKNAFRLAEVSNP